MWTRYRALILYVIAFLNEAKGTGTQWNEDESGQLGCMAPGQLCYQGKLHSEEDLNDADERCQPKQDRDGGCCGGYTCVKYDFVISSCYCDPFLGVYHGVGAMTRSSECEFCPFSARTSQQSGSVLAYLIRGSQKIGCLEPGTICWKGTFDRKGVEKSCLDNGQFDSCCFGLTCVGGGLGQDTVCYCDPFVFNWGTSEPGTTLVTDDMCSPCSE